MKTAKKNTRRLGFLTAILASAAASLTLAAPALAGPVWTINSSSNTTVAPGGTLDYVVETVNTGDSATDGSEFKVTVELPPGITGVSAKGGIYYSCPSVAGETIIECTAAAVVTGGTLPVLVLTASVDPNAAGVHVAHLEVSGGGTPSATTVDPVTVTPTPPLFGFDALDVTPAADTTGAPLSQAAGRPYSLTTSIDFNTITDPSPVVGRLHPVETPRDIIVDLPPGLVGTVTGLPKCTIPELAHVDGQGLTAPQCPVAAQVGTTLVRHSGSPDTAVPNVLGGGPIPVYNMVPPPGVPARFGFLVAGPVVLDVEPRTDGDYGLTARVAGVSEGLAIIGSDLSFWGVPSDPIHDPQRACPELAFPSSGGPSAPSGCPGAYQRPEPRAFFRMPTSCTAPGQGLPYTARIDSWENPGVFVDKTIHSHQPNGYPYPEGDWGAPAGIEDCDKVPFEPTISATPTTDAADSPSGLNVDLSIPQDCWDDNQAEAICQSDLREADVTLPQGMSVNPSSAGGLSACTPAQVGLTTAIGSAPIHFDQAPVSCPDAAKIGSVVIETPLLEEELKGFVYLAQQSQNPFGSLLAMYIVAEGAGVVVKQAGEIVADPNTGKLTTRFDEVPQLPFTNLHLGLYGGQRAALRTPPACGSYATTGELTPWSANPPVSVSSSFQITQGCGGGFDPKLEAGTQNPLAGSYSPFHLRLSRADGTQEIGALSATLAPGLIGRPAGIPYCPDSVLASFPAPTVLGSGAGEIAAPKCPAASQVGKVTVGAGAGLNPFYTSSGRAYLAGPYKNAPLSLAVVAPAVAGPFDLGSVVVRNALRVNPETAQITAVSDPLPSILHGIPLDLRDVRVDLDRADFTLNPTSCDPQSIDATLTSTQGASAQRSSRFQAANCDRLGFKPKLALRLKGSTKRSGHPALRAVLKARPGDANIGRVQVALPHSEFLAQSHIRTVCTRVQFAAGSGGGASCPKGSIYGKVTATSPLVDYPLTGNVYLRSSANPLPDMVLALHGPPTQPIEVDAVGRIDSKNGGIRTTFAAVPDAPLTKVVLQLPGGQKSLLENSTNICRSTNKATIKMDAHSGKVRDTNPALKVKCAKNGKRK